MRLLDLFCGAGGAGVGYARAGFEVVGVDIEHQPRYPFEFHQADAMTYPLDGFDVIHASPPCQRYSEATPLRHRDRHADLIEPCRVRLRAAGAPYVIENVSGARAYLENPLMLCGTMFELRLWRHRYFEIWPDPPLLSPFTCDHGRRPVVTHAGSNSRKLGPVVVTGTTRRRSGRFEFSVADCRVAMGIPWMTRAELDQAVPPAYTEHIGRLIMGTDTP